MRGVPVQAVFGGFTVLLAIGMAGWSGVPKVFGSLRELEHVRPR